MDRHINAQSIAGNGEYAGTIYQLPDGKHAYTTPQTLNPPSPDTSGPAAWIVSH